MLPELPKIVVDWATVIAPLVAILPLFISPDKATKFLPRLWVRCKTLVALAAMIIFLILLPRQAFMHRAIPLWIVIDVFSATLLMGLGINRFLSARRRMRAKLMPVTVPIPAGPLTSITDGDVRWELSSSSIINSTPICGACLRDMKRLESTKTYRSTLEMGNILDRWQCPKCNRVQEWNVSQHGDPVKAAVQMFNAEMRRRDSTHRITVSSTYGEPRRPM